MIQGIIDLNWRGNVDRHLDPEIFSMIVYHCAIGTLSSFAHVNPLHF